MPHNFNLIKTIKLIFYRKNTIFFVLIACVLLVSCGSKRDGKASASATSSSKSGSNIGQSNSPVRQADVSSIDAIVDTIYEAISFREGEEPNWDRFRSLFTSNAQFIRITQDGVNTMDVRSFISSFRDRVKTGALRSFYEAEISRDTDAFGSISQIFSTYNKRMNTEDPESFVRGINSIQLYHDGQRWWISSILWEDERGDNLIPQKYLR